MAKTKIVENGNKYMLKNKLKKSLQILLLVFLIGGAGMYFTQRSTWIYKGQPYPKAKEWLIPANMTLVLGVFLSKLPFVDERSLIMQPLFSLQDFFIRKWQENLPDNDAEKYTAWYVFKLMPHIMETGGGIVLYSSKKYSFDDVVRFNELSWKTIKNMVKYSAKDKEFQEIRYAAFNNLSALFVTNFTAYWLHNPLLGGFSSDIDKSKFENRYLTKDTYVNSTNMLNDTKQHKRLIVLYEWIKKMDKLYASKYPNIYQKIKNHKMAKYWEKSRLLKITYMILDYQITTKQYLNIDSFCTLHNKYIKDYIKSKRWLLENIEILKAKNIIIDNMISNKRDEQIQKVCPNIEIKKYAN